MRNKIKSITLKNFKTYIDQTISFCPLTNSITGETDNGKTNILRAMKWCLWNQPSGDGMIRLGEAVCTVIVKFINGLEITRERSLGGSTNRYSIKYPDGQTTTLNKFGINVPDEVLQAHKMNPVDFNKEKCILNYAEQLDGPFMLKYSKRDRAKAIGALAGTDVVDYAITDTRKDVREKSAELKVMIKLLKEIREKIGEFENLEEMATLLNKLNESYSNAINNINNLDTIKRVSNKLSEDISKVDKTRAIVNQLKNIDIFEEDLSKVEETFTLNKSVSRVNVKLIEERERIDEASAKIEKCKDVDKLSDIIHEIAESFASTSEVIKLKRKLDKSLEELNEVTMKINSISDTQDIDDKIVSLQGSITSFQDISKVSKKIDECSIRYKSKSEEISEIEESLNSAIEEFKEKLSQFKRCPLCFSDISDDIIANIGDKIGEE